MYNVVLGEIMRTKEQQRKYNQTYYEKYKEKLKQDANAYYAANKDKVLETVAKYRNENRNKIRKNDKEYYRRKPELRLLGAARARAKKYGIELNIEEKDISIPEYCPLLGIKISIADGKKTSKANSPSLDRIDSTKGYIKGNVWVISHKANTMKSNSTFEEFSMMATNWKKCMENNYDTFLGH